MMRNILDNTTTLYMIKYTIGEIFSSGGATLYKNPSDQTVIPRKITHPNPQRNGACQDPKTHNQIWVSVTRTHHYFLKVLLHM